MEKIRVEKAVGKEIRGAAMIGTADLDEMHDLTSLSSATI